MIEVEKKFILKSGDFERLSVQAEFVKEISYTDTYYDTNDFLLLKNDKYLRKRDSRFEMKLPLNKEGKKRLVDQYDELETEEEIRKFLNLPSKDTLENDLASNGYIPFCTFRTTRKKYRLDPFTLDFDSVNFGDSSYDVMEIELMVKEESEIENAVSKILDFAEKYQLGIASVRGKVRTYLSRYNKELYEQIAEK